MSGRIAIINLTRMGDLLMTGPMMDRLREEHPGCALELVAVEGFVPIALGMGVDRVIPVDFNRLTTLGVIAESEGGRDSLAALYRRVRDGIAPLLSTEYEAIYNVSYTMISAMMATLMRGPVRGGLYLDVEGCRVIEGAWARYFFAGNLNRGINPFHLVDVTVGVGGALSSRGERPRMSYRIPEEAVREVQAEAEHLGLAGRGPLVALQCGASTEDKRWDAGNFGTAGKLLRERHGASLVLLGTEEEREWAETAAEVIGEGACNLAGRTDLPHLAAWLARADLLITNDTGTMHLAQAVGTRSLVLTLGSALSDETGPYGEGNLIVEPEIECFPCSFHVQCPHYDCHRKIRPELVASLAEKMLAGEPIENAAASAAGREARIWCTGFDEDGWWRKWPVGTIPASAESIARELYRELIKALLEPRLRPGGPEADRVARALARVHAAPLEEEPVRVLRRDLDAAGELLSDSRRGMAMAKELASLAEEPEEHLSRIGSLGDEIESVDRRLGERMIVHPLWRPLLMLFQFGKQNLPAEGLRAQAEATVLVYRDLDRAVLWMRDLAGKVLELMNRGDDGVTEPPDAAPAGSPAYPAEDDGVSGAPPESVVESPAAAEPGADRLEPGNGRTVQAATGGSRWTRPRMKRPPYHVLLLASDYYIQGELGDALRRLGHRVTELRFEEDSEFIPHLLAAGMDADLLVTINHLGFDSRGELASLLRRIGLPYASWFVDRPGFILLDHAKQADEAAFLFTWERSTLEEIRAYGFENVEFLPLATDPERFVPGPDGGEGALRWVANSMVAPSASWRMKAGIGAVKSPLLERTVMLLRGERVEATAALREAANQEGIDISGWSRRQELTFASAAAFTATRELRRELAHACAPFRLTLYGDEGWRSLLPDLPWMGPVEYPDGLPRIYRGGVHLNATSYQMPTSVNQRVFDIPASGGILLTDAQEDLRSLFRVEQECFVYRDTAEAVDLARFLLKHRDRGENRMKKARERILQNHTYDHRAETLIKAVERKVGRTAVLVEGG